MNCNNGINKGKVLWTVLLLLALLLWWGEVEAEGMRFIYANDNLGELDSCG